MNEKFMILILYEKIVFQTNLPKAETINRLLNVVQPFQMWSRNKRQDGKKYYGKIIGNKFDIMKMIRGRDSFNPTILGDISETNNKTIISVRMRLHLGVIIFMLIWCGFIVIGMCRSKSNDSSWMVGAGMILFLYIIAMFFFNIAKEKVKDDLRIILDGEIIRKQ